jgi:hypothetical protein
MKTFYTSNYERSSTSPLAVSISNPADVPATYEGARDADLSPTDDLLERYHARDVSHEGYAAAYIALLGERGITPQSIADKFEEGTIFVCYDYEDGASGSEDADTGTADDLSICHRVFLSKWLNDSGVVTISEI